MTWLSSPSASVCHAPVVAPFSLTGGPSSRKISVPASENSMYSFPFVSHPIRSLDERNDEKPTHLAGFALHSECGQKLPRRIESLENIICRCRPIWGSQK